MEDELYNLHLRVGFLCGEEKTCGKKIKYEDEVSAEKAAKSLNKSKNKRHDCEPYPCYFCDKWHIGGVMPYDKLKELEEFLSIKQ